MFTRNKVIENVFRINLNVKRREKVLVFTDSKRKVLNNIAERFKQIGKGFTEKIKFINYPSTGNHGIEPPEILWKEAFGENLLKDLKEKKLFKPLTTKNIIEEQVREAEKTVREFKKDAVHVVIALSHYSTSHTRFRDLLTKMCGTRYASMPLFDELMLDGPMQVDWKKMTERTEEIARMVRKCRSIMVKTPNGTEISFSKEERRVYTDTGFITESGDFSNLPAGEVYLAPVEGTANGQLVLEWAPTRRLKSPVTLSVKNGRVVSVKGKDIYAGQLQKKLAEKPENSNVAELGIGTNDKAARLDNILETEKISGTIHVALGDNSSFGGKVKAPFHQDFVFLSPTVILINKKSRKTLLNHGKLAQVRYLL